MSIMPTSGNNHRRIIVFEDKIKELNLSEEERAAFRRAKSQLQNHSRLGALAGLLAGGYFSKIKKYRLGISVALCLGSITMGSQIGFFTGTAAGIRTIKSLPNSQRIFEAIKDAHLRNISPSKNQESSKNQDQGGDDDQSSTLSDEFASDNRDLGDNEDEQQSSWAKYRSTPTSQQQQQSSSQQDNSSWDEIRAKNSSSSTWDKIRQNNKTAQQQEQKPTFNDETSNENIPRTREDFEGLYGEGRIRTNQYGDIEIINK